MPYPIFKASLVSALLFLAIADPQSARAQDAQAGPMLSLGEAIRVGVERNFSLSLSRSGAEQAANARRGGVGAFLPSASAGLSHSGPLPLEETSPRTSLDGSLDWIVFDGFQNYHGYRRLKSQEAASRLQERQDAETLVETIIVSYYDIVQQKQRMKAIRDLLGVSQERARLAQAKLEIGAGSRLEQLQSLSDLNEDSSVFLGQDASLGQSKIRLNLLLARDPGLEFDVADSIPLEPSLPLEAWRGTLAENNASVAAARAQRGAAASALGEARGGWLPRLTTGVSYATAPDYLNESSRGQDRSGFSYNVRLSVPLFDRLATRTAVRRAKLEVRDGETRLRQAEAQALADFDLARREYETGLRRIALEERNLQVARLQAEAAQERYKVGASSPLEFRDAQTRLLDAEGRLITARQTVKQSEAALQRLSGALIRPASARADSVGADAGSPAEGK